VRASPFLTIRASAVPRSSRYPDDPAVDAAAAITLLVVEMYPLPAVCRRITAGEGPHY
jgi:hypothetical protein